MTRAGPWLKWGALAWSRDGRVVGLVSIEGKAPVAIEMRNDGLMRVLFERPGEEREPFGHLGVMPGYVWDGAP